MTSPLDNTAWHALRGPQRALAEGGALAARYPPDVSPFAALPDEPSDDAWAALASLVTGCGDVTVLIRDEIREPAGWSTVQRFLAYQMVAESVEGAVFDRATELGGGDVDDMLALVALAAPGPFGPRTVELGRYIGIREGGSLVAMAGERMHVDGHREVSAVCTHPDHRGRGLAEALVRDIVAGVTARGEVPILHVEQKNVSAIRLYERLGFAIRRAIEGAVLEPPGS